MPQLFKVTDQGQKKEKLGSMPSIGMAGPFKGMDADGNKIRTELYNTTLDRNGFRKDKKIELDWDKLGVDRVLYYEHEGNGHFKAFIFAKDEDAITDEERQRLKDYLRF